MYDYAKFTDSEIADCGRNLRSVASGASSIEDAASKIVGYLYDNITDSAGQKANVMVRLFKVHPYNKLERRVAVLCSRLPLCSFGTGLRARL